MKSKANITPPVANATRLAKFDLATLQFAYDTLAASQQLGSVQLKSVDAGVKKLLELRHAIASHLIGGFGKFATVQSLAEALLKVEVYDGVGLPYDEVLFICRQQFNKAETTMNCIRWYASRMQKGENATVLPPRPASTSVATA